MDDPFCAVIIPLEEGDLRVELDVLANAELAGTLLEVLEEYGLRGVVGRPVNLLGEAVAVKRVRNVDTRTRIGVLKPGAADVVVLLEDGERYAGLLEPNPREDAGHPCADDDDAERNRGVLPPGGSAGVLALGREFFEQERDVVLRNRRAGHPRRNPEQRLFDGDLAGDLAVAEPLEGFEGDFLRLGLLGGRHTALLDARGNARRPQRFAEDREVAGSLGECRQQCREEGVFESCAKLVIGCDERLDGAADWHRCCLLLTAAGAAVLPRKG